MAILAPLILPGQLHALPQGYGHRLPLFDKNSSITANQNIVKVTNFIDLEEVDEEDAKMRIIVQIFSGEVKVWFRSLNANSIATSNQLIDAFIARWEVNKNPLKIHSEYNNLKREPNESVKDFTAQFNRLYHSIPNEMKTPPGLDLLHYPDGFDPDMAYQLRERNLAMLEDMHRKTISVEANLSIKKSKM